MSERVLCCPTDRAGVPGVEREWRGKTVTLARAMEPMACYVSTTPRSKHWLIVVYDIFGMHPNKYELADFMADVKSINVAVPDVRRGRNWPMHLYPPPTEEAREAFYEYLARDANPELRTAETRATIDFVIDECGAESVSLLGLCWGAKVCSLIDNYRGVRCVIGAHPSFLKPDDGERTTVPTLMLPCKEDNLTQYLAGCLRNKNPRLFSVSDAYLGTFHGFLGARGQWLLAEEKPFVDRAKEDISAFVLAHVGDTVVKGKECKCAEARPASLSA